MMIHEKYIADSFNPNQSATESPVMKIGLAGGGGYCHEILNKIVRDYKEKDVNARFSAVADPNPNSPGMLFAKELGIPTLTNYDALYDPKYGIELIILTTPDHHLLERIIKTRPPHIRVMPYQVFEIFWKAICFEEKKLRTQNEEMKTILNGIQDFILVIKPNGEIENVNDAFCDKMNFYREEVIGKKCYEVLRNLSEPCEHVDMDCPLNEVVRNRRPSQHVIARTGRDGLLRYIDVSVFPIWEKDGKISKFIEISRDITKRKTEEEEMTRRLERMVAERTRELQETHEKLLHQDKMASLGKLAASVVHEINNPIAGILNLIVLMKRITKEGPVGEKEMDQFRQFLDLMEAETRRISKIVMNLLAFSRQSKMEFKPVNLNKLLDITLFMNSNLLKLNGVKVERCIHPDLPEIIGSEDQLQQVFMNIVSNAAESMESTPTKVLTIGTEYFAQDNWIKIIFSDTGVGIPKENLSKLFEPFFTTKKKGKGVGLGLSVAYGIVKEHGGCFLVESKEGVGTTFVVQLPLVPPKRDHIDIDE